MNSQRKIVDHYAVHCNAYWTMPLIKYNNLWHKNSHHAVESFRKELVNTA